MMSRMAPRVARTSFVSAAGGYWKCMPRSVPFRRLNAMLAWAMSGFSPCSANSRWQNARAKNPRLSSRRSTSRTKAPLSFVSLKIMLGRLPAQRLVHSSGGEQLLQVVDPLEARTLAVLERPARHAW